MDIKMLMEKLKNGDTLTREMRYEILESYKLIDVAWDSILNGLIIIDTDLRVKKFNHKISELFQMREDEIFKLDMSHVLKDIDVVDNIFILVAKIIITIVIYEQMQFIDFRLLHADKIAKQGNKLIISPGYPDLLFLAANQAF